LQFLFYIIILYRR